MQLTKQVTSLKTIDQFRVNDLQRAINLLQQAQWDEFSFRRCELISKLKDQLKAILQQY